MLKKGFLRNQSNEDENHKRIAPMISKTLLYTGVLVLVASFGYLLVNLEKSDFLIGMVLPFLVAGLGLIIVSQLIQRAYNKLRK